MLGFSLSPLPPQVPHISFVWNLHMETPGLLGAKSDLFRGFTSLFSGAVGVPPIGGYHAASLTMGHGYGQGLHKYVGIDLGIEILNGYSWKISGNDNIPCHPHE